MENKNEKLQNGVMKLDVDELESVAGGQDPSAGDGGQPDFIYCSWSFDESGDLPLFKTGDIILYRSTKAMILDVGEKGGAKYLEFKYRIRIIEETSNHLNEEGWTYEHQIVPYFNLHEMFPTVF